MDLHCNLANLQIEKMSDNFDIEREEKLAPDTIDMVLEVDNYLRSLYPADCCYGFKPNQLEDPSIYFFVVRDNGFPIACAGIKIYGDDPDDRYAEVKRMYVRPSHRGKGLAKRLLNKLEGESKVLGFSIIRLETGIRQPEAIVLYEKVGYKKRSVFGEYRVSDLNVFYEKLL